MSSRAPVFFTIVANNYLAFAKVLFASIRSRYPDAQPVLCVVDDPDVARSVLGSGFRLVPVQALGLPHPEHFLFRYDVMELSTAAKPYVFRWILEHVDEARNGVVYIDPDIQLFRQLDEVEALLGGGALAVLTPHLTAPLDDDRFPSEQSIMRCGAYNCGFVALGNHPERARFVDWWARRLEHGAFVDLEEGLFTDQKWMDLAPGLFPDVRILRHPGYNVAYWNLAHRRIQRTAGGYVVNGEPLAFFHFSGIEPDNPKTFSKYQNRFTEADLGEFGPAYRAYVDALLANGYEELRKLPYAFGRLNSGTRIVAEIRRLFRDEFDVGAARPVEHPFAMDETLFDEPYLQISREAPRISKLAYQVWKRRPELREAFDISTVAGREGLLAWFVARGERTVVIERARVDAMKLELDRYRGGRDVGGSFGGRDSSPIGRLAAPAARMAMRALDAMRNSRILRGLYFRMPAVVRAPVDRTLVRVLLRSTLWREPTRPPRTKAIEPGPREPGGLNLIGYFRGDFGVADCARFYAEAALAAGLPVTLLNFEGGMAQERIADRRLEWRLDKAPRFSANLCIVNADQTPLLFEQLGADVLRGRYNIGYWFWELARFPQAWRRSLELVDEVWVATDFVREAVESVRSGKPVRIMPYPLAFELDRPYSRAEFGLTEGPFTFLFSFDFHSFVDRKNPEAVLRAFQSAFPVSAGEDVALVMKSVGSSRSPERARALADLSRMDPRVRFIDRALDRKSMWGLQSVCDCYVSLHRCEGLGLGLVESMYLGKPVIGTAYSGNLQFMRPDNSCLVDFRLVDVPSGAYPHAEGQQWAEPDVDHAARWMRQLVDDAAFRARIASAGQQSVRAQFDPRVVAEALRREIARLAALPQAG